MADFDVTADGAIPETAEQAEALINHWKEPKDEGVGTAPAEEAAPAPEKELEYKIPYRGKEEAYPISKILEFANQGRDYSERMRELRTQRELFEKKYPSDLTERLNRYKEIEAFVKDNPQWWDHVNQTWVTRTQFGQAGQPATGQPTPVDPAVQALLNEVQPMKQEIDQWKQEREAKRVAEEDGQLDGQISEYRTKYSQFDWKTLDHNNQNLEQRILRHAIDNGIKSFRAAANDFLHDEHVKQVATLAKENLGKEIQKNTKLGLGPVTQTKRLPVNRVQNTGAKSWDEISREAKASLGL